MPSTTDSNSGFEAVWSSVSALPRPQQLEIANRVLKGGANFTPSLEERRAGIASLTGCLKEWSHLTDADIEQMIDEERTKRYL